LAERIEACSLLETRVQQLKAEIAIKEGELATLDSARMEHQVARTAMREIVPILIPPVLNPNACEYTIQPRDCLLISRSQQSAPRHLECALVLLQGAACSALHGPRR
jgi:hypothetical protein